MTRLKRKNGMESGRWEILATDVEEWGTTPGNVPQPKAKAKAKAKAAAIDGARAERWHLARERKEHGQR